jgi:hypothetical protein
MATTRNRLLKSVKDELIKKSREAILAAVQIYNNPQITFKSETFITLAVIAWTYLMHAYYRGQGIEYRYFNKNGKKKVFEKTSKGADKYWELEKCLNYDRCPLDAATKKNLKFLIGIRHEIEHQMTNQIDEYFSAKLQACAINYNDYVSQLFGAKYSVSKELAITIQFAAINPTQQKQLASADKPTANVRAYIAEFENALTKDEYNNTRYAYRVLYSPISAKQKGQADSVIKFVRPDSPLAEENQRILIQEKEPVKFLPGEIVKQMQEEGFPKFKMSQHTGLWKKNDVKNPEKKYGTYVGGNKKWYWYKKWLDFVRQHCQDSAAKYQ